MLTGPHCPLTSVVQCLEPLHVELRLAVVREEPVDLLLDVGELGIADADDPGTLAMASYRPRSRLRALGRLLDAGVAPGAFRRRLSGHVIRDAAEFGEQDRRAIVW